LIASPKNKSLEWYDPPDKWTFGPSLTKVHYGGAAMTLNNRICGGMEHDGTNAIVISLTH
jgi:hypothetical protein